MKQAMKRMIAVVLFVVLLLSNVSMASAVTSDWVFYGDYTDVTTLYNYSGTYPSMQGLAVGSQYLYAIKINSGDSLATIAMVDKDTGSTTWLKDSSDGSVLFSGFDHANDMAVWGIDGASHLFIATTKQGANAIWRLERDGSYLTRVTSYHLTCDGEDICATAMDVMNVDSNGYIHYITKWGQDIYTGKVHKDTMNATIEMTKICTISKDMAYIKGEKLDLSDWVNQGFGYYDNTLFVPLSGPDSALHRSVVLVYNLDNVPQGATIYATDYLNFRVTSGAYSALFEIESVDICSADKKLYFNTNRRVTDSNTNHDGISSFDGYTYTKPTAASFDAIKHFNAKFLPNGGTGTMAVQRINNGIATKLSKNLYTKPGYTFAGWSAHRLAQNQWYYTNGSSTGWYAEGSQPSGYYLYIYRDQQAVAATSNVHADTVEFNATWTPAQYTVKFDANGGTGNAIADISFNADSTGTLPASTFTKAGCTFAGWQVSGLDDVLQPGASVKDLVNYIGKGNNTGNTVTLVAKWQSDSYTITWNVDGKITKETYAYGATPSYKGSTEKAAEGCTAYYFTGWNKNITTVTGDFTYIAQFTPSTKHTKIVTDAAVAPTCSSTGLTEGSHCEACGNVIVAQEVVAASSHMTPVYTNNGTTHSAVYPCCGTTYVTGEAHSYTGGKCICGALEAPPTYYLFGYINGKDYACEADFMNMGTYKFEDGKLTTTFTEDSYVAVKTENNGAWYMTNGWQGEVNSVTLYNTTTLGTNADKLYVPGGVEVTFTLVDNGDGTVTLSYTEAEPEPVVKPEITLKYPTLSFEGEVFYNVYYTVSNATVDVEDMGLLTWYNRPANTAAATYDTAEQIIPGAGYNAGADMYMVRSQGVPAKKLGDNMYLRIYAKLSDGSYVYSPVTYYNAKFYASDILANSQNEDMKSLVVAMLNYGAAAQVHFNHNASNLMNADLTAAQKALAKDFSSSMISTVLTPDTTKTANFKSNGGFSGGYPSVSFDGAFSINFYLTPKKTIENEMTMYCWNLKTYNSVSALTEANANAKVTMVPATNPAEYFANYTGIAAKQIDETVFVAGVYTSGGVRYSSPVMCYSLSAYCADQIANGTATMQDFAKATVVYGDAAKTYFANLNG